MPVCSFCRRRYKEPRGLTVFTFDGKSIHYCSSKCIKNHKLGREARKLNWVKRGKGFLEESGGVDEESSEKSEKVLEKQEKK